MANVMICDDEPVSVRRLIDRLAYEGFDVDLSVSAEECLQKSKARAYDVFVLDMDLGPSRSNGIWHGLELAKILWSRPTTHEIPIIGISGHTLPLADRAEQFGLASFLKKPLDARVLLDNLHMLLHLNVPEPTVPELGEVGKQYAELRKLMARSAEGEDIEVEVERGFARLHELQSRQADFLEEQFKERRCFDPAKGRQALAKAREILGEDPARDD